MLTWAVHVLLVLYMEPKCCTRTTIQHGDGAICPCGLLICLNLFSFLDAAAWHPCQSWKL